MKTTTKLFAILLTLSLMLSVLASCSSSKDAEGGLNDAMEPSMNGVLTNREDFAIGDEEYNEDQVTSGTPVFIENPFIATAENNVSTFSADVDTASYAYFRKLVNAGYSLSELKGAHTSFRTEEFINYFDYAVEQPDEGELFGLAADVFPCPWNSGTVLLRMTLQAETPDVSAGNNLVFLIDVSGSMSSNDKLPLLKQSFSQLVASLTPRDTVSIVTYSGREQVVLDGCSGSDGERIMNAINSLKASGSTNGEAGLSKAYRVAESHYIEGGNNRIIMASDGDLNVGISSPEQLKSYISQKRDAGIYLSVLGFGTGNYRDGAMEALADNGNGIYYYIDGISEAEKVFGGDLLGTLYTVAEDVKLQLTFDSSCVSSYRLIGYENRLLNAEDFENDAKDAGEVGAGHQVTVCYELTLAEGAKDEAVGAWMKLAVRYKNPGESVSLLNEYGIGAECYTDTPSEDLCFLSAVIQTAMLLHQSKYAPDLTVASVLDQLHSVNLQDPLRAEFRALLENLK